MADALEQNAKGIIFDLRGNPGGLLSQAVEVANVFLEDADVLIERFGHGWLRNGYIRDGCSVARGPESGKCSRLTRR